jgi:hypothetical protein
VGAVNRTKLQIEADEIDMATFRLAGRLFALADEMKGDRGAEIRAHGRAVAAARSTIRMLMHPDDREATK